MKKFGIIAMAFVLLMGMSQCKKEKTETPASEGVKVPITLNVNGGNGSRVDVNTSNGVVTFEVGDMLNVVSNGVFVGTLYYGYNGVFSGEIIEPVIGERLQFYFLGNKTPSFNADNTECSVVISGQETKLPVISYAPSREYYEVGKTDYNATLLNKCALVKFDVTTASEAATCILGMNNKVTVDFSTNEFAYSQIAEGVITLSEGNGERWAILLPQDEVTEAEAQAADGSFTGTCGTIPAITENDYLTEGITVAIETPVGPVGPVGIINGVYTVNANGDQVWFSQGNLQYQASTNTWRFAENQWDYVGGTQWEEQYGNVEGSSNNDISPTYSGWIDLFGWGTSGYDHGANAYQPWSTSTDNSDYYPYGEIESNLYDQNGQADWGYNAIDNGGNAENIGWRTLTWPEWEYVFHSRNTTSGFRFVEANVNGVDGTILLPDNWSSSVYELNNPNECNGYSNNTVTADDWVNVLEANGAVFLPAAGTREETSFSFSGGGNSFGYYWSASACSDFARCVRFYYYGWYLETDYAISRPLGCSVRLVRNTE